MKVYKSGQRVKTVIGGIEGIVVGVCIRGNNLEYHIHYFSQGEHKSVWMFDCEIEPVVITKQKAGFKNYDSETEFNDFKLIE